MKARALLLVALLLSPAAHAFLTAPGFTAASCAVGYVGDRAGGFCHAASPSPVSVPFSTPTNVYSTANLSGQVAVLVEFRVLRSGVGSSCSLSIISGGASPSYNVTRILTVPASTAVFLTVPVPLSKTALNLVTVNLLAGTDCSSATATVLGYWQG